MVTELELIGVASASRGGPVGAEEGNKEHQAREKMHILTLDKLSYHLQMF